MDPVTIVKTAQIAGTLAKSRTLRRVIIGSVLLQAMALLTLALAPTDLVATMAGGRHAQQALAAAGGGRTGCPVRLGEPGSVRGAGLSSVQVGNAHTIWTVSVELGLPGRAAVIAIETAMQESALRNLDYGDLDSLGLFQQRASWGPASVRMDPAGSSRLFYRALTRVEGWESLPVTVAAQRVQRSAYPDAYARHESAAQTLVDLFTTGSTDPSSGAAHAIPDETACHPAGTDGTNRDGARNDGDSSRVVLPVAKYRLTARFGQCSSHWAACHTGLDFAVPAGRTIHAVAGGVVTFAGWAGPYGNLTKIKINSSTEVWYAHQSKQSVHVGQHVHAGQSIGRVGATGNTTGPHLHLEIRVNGTPVDPDPWLTARGAQP